MSLLGYLIDRPDLANVEAVTGFTVPKTLVRAYSFLGLVSSFRRFIGNFSITAAPLYNLLRKSAQFKCYEK